MPRRVLFLEQEQSVGGTFPLRGQKLKQNLNETLQKKGGDKKNCSKNYSHSERDYFTF